VLAPLANAGGTLFVFACLIAAPAAANANTVAPRRELNVRERPSSSARIIERVPAGTLLTLVSRKGEWARVRHQRREGWVPGVLVHRAEAAPRLLAAHGGDRPAAPASDDAELTNSATVPAPPRRTAWVSVSQYHDDGSAPRAGALGRSAEAASDGGSTDPAPQVLAAYDPPRPRSGVLAAVRGGVAILGQRVISDGAARLASYTFETTAAAVGVTLGFERRVGRRLVLGLDGNYAYAGGSGVRYQAPDGSTGILAVQQHNADAGGSLGVRFHALGGASLRARVGAVVVIDIVDLAAGAPPLPSDRVIGMHAGLLLDVPRLLSLGTRALGVRLGLAAIAPAQITQNIQDGAALSVWGLAAGAGVSIALAGDAARGRLSLGAEWAFAGLFVHASGRPTLCDAAPSACRDATTVDRQSTRHLLALSLAYSL
jgi:hypothetical protein